MGLAVKRSSFLLFQAYCGKPAFLPACTRPSPAGRTHSCAFPVAPKVASQAAWLPACLTGRPAAAWRGAPAGALHMPASRSFGLDALVLAFLTLWLSTQQALTILMGLWRRRQWWRRRRPLKAKRSLSIRKPAGVAWQHALLYNSRKLATVAPPLAAHAARPTAATAIWPSLSKAVRGY